jgi:hypothetical protein
LRPSYAPFLRRLCLQASSESAPAASHTPRRHSLEHALLSIPLSVVELLLPYSLAVAFLLWFLWKLFRETRR